MATIHDFGGRESLQYAVARRLRGLLGELNMAKTEFAELLDWDRGYLYRRLSGKTPLNTADLDVIENVVGFRADYLVGGHEPKIVSPSPDGGGNESLLSGSNRGQHAYLVHSRPAALPPAEPLADAA